MDAALSGIDGSREALRDSIIEYAASRAARAVDAADEMLDFKEENEKCDAYWRFLHDSLPQEQLGVLVEWDAERNAICDHHAEACFFAGLREGIAFSHIFTGFMEALSLTSSAKTKEPEAASVRG
jgi:hypothetical protein